MSAWARKLIIALFVAAVIGGVAVSYFLYQQRPPAPEAEQEAAPSDEAAPSPQEAREQDPAASRAEGESEPEPSETTEPSQQARAAERSVTVEECAEYLSRACREAARDEAFAVELLRHHMQTNPRARGAMRVIGMQMRPFRFVGRVVDPEGEPIADAEVVYRIGFPFSLGHTEAATTTTDERGRFRIEGRGYSLFIRTIRYPGLTPAPSFPENREFGPDPRKGHLSWEQATADSPKEFVLMRGRSSE